MPDCYDAAIAYLQDHPGEIHEAWNHPCFHPAGCLFRYVHNRERVKCCAGCLTQIRAGGGVVAAGRDGLGDPKLTREIRADERIPKSPHAITLDDLPVFAEWNRRLDQELDREPLQETNDD